MHHTPWCQDRTHDHEGGCATAPARVGDVGLWMYDDSTGPVVILDPEPATLGLTPSQARQLAEELRGLADAAGVPAEAGATSGP